jgi:hypothetical protein
MPVTAPATPCCIIFPEAGGIAGVFVIFMVTKVVSAAEISLNDIIEQMNSKLRLFIGLAF